MTKIEWATEVWNPVTGCTPISPGCKNCYAKRMAKRLAGRFGYPKENPFQVVIHNARFYKPDKWKTTKRVFVTSMGDLFHKDVPCSYILDVIHYARSFSNSDVKHTFIFLTKRPERMRHVLELGDIRGYMNHMWFGVSVSTQEEADTKIPILLGTKAAVRFVSIEPQLELMKLDADWIYPRCQMCGRHWIRMDSGRCPECEDVQYNTNKNNLLDWVICGAESGPGRRPFELDWARSLRDQCVDSGVPFFLKQVSDDGIFCRTSYLDGERWEQYPQIGINVASIER